MKPKSEPAKSRSFIGAFTEHPASVGESYFQHMGFAAKFAATLFAAGFAALVHAVIPPLFETTASRLIRQLYQRMENRG